MTLDPDFVLNCVLRQHVWSSEAWLSKHGYSLILVRNVVGEKNTCGIARFFCGSTAFLFVFHVAYGLGPITVFDNDSMKVAH